MSKGVGTGTGATAGAGFVLPDISSSNLSIGAGNSLLSSSSSSSSIKEQQPQLSSTAVNGSPVKDSRSLADVNVSLETIQPGIGTEKLITNIITPRKCNCIINLIISRLLLTFMKL